MHLEFSHHMARVQARNTLMIGLLLGILLSSLQIFWDFLDQRQTIDSTIDQVVGSLSESAAKAAYEIDPMLAGKVLNGLLNFHPVMEARIVDDFGDMLAFQRRAPKNGPYKWLAEVLFGKELHYQKPLTFGGSSLYVGMLEVWVDNYVVASSFFARSIRNLGVIFTYTVLLTILLAMWFNYSITRPLLRLYDQVMQIDPSDPAAATIVPPRGHEQDEMALQAQAINRLLEGFGQSLESRRAAERQLEERGAYLRSIMENVPDGILTINPQGRVESFNPAAEQLFGRSPEQFLNLAFSELFESFDSDGLHHRLKAWMHDPELKPFRDYLINATAQRPDGSESRLELRFSEMKLGERNLVICVANDVTAREKAEEALRDSEERFRLTFYQAAVGIVHIALDGAYLMVNRHMEQVLGFNQDEFLNVRFTDLAHPDDLSVELQNNRQLLEDQVEGYTLEKRIRRKDGSYAWCNCSTSLMRGADGDPKYFISVIEDITRRRLAEEEKSRLEAQLRQAQKMEAVGTLAGGVAHDFNNILQALSGYVQLMTKNPVLKSEGGEYLSQMDSSLGRAAGMIKQMLTFSRKMEPQLEPINLNQVVHDSVALLKTSLPKMIAIEVNLAGDLANVNGDSSLLEQIVLNLGTNARDAMPEGGSLFISTQNVTLSESTDADIYDLNPGEYVALSVKDTGMGMEPGLLRHIFEPFFTTKGVGKGTGLGLATAYGIVKNHGGHISCNSIPGKGTEFIIYLPVYHGQLSQMSDNIEAPESGQAPQSSAPGSILLVDDEVPVQEIGREILQDYGYAVQVAGTGEEAIEKYGANPDAFDLVIMDLGMPGMGGRAALEKILEIDPGAKVVIASGYAEEGQAKVVLQRGATDFIAKPYRLAGLIRKVQEILGA